MAAVRTPLRPAKRAYPQAPPGLLTLLRSCFESAANSGACTIYIAEIVSAQKSTAIMKWQGVKLKSTLGSFLPGFKRHGFAGDPWLTQSISF